MKHAGDSILNHQFWRSRSDTEPCFASKRGLASGRLWVGRSARFSPTIKYEKTGPLDEAQTGYTLFPAAGTLRTARPSRQAFRSCQKLGCAAHHLLIARCTARQRRVAAFPRTRKSCRSGDVSCPHYCRFSIGGRSPTCPAKGLVFEVTGSCEKINNQHRQECLCHTESIEFICKLWHRHSCLCGS